MNASRNGDDTPDKPLHAHQDTVWMSGRVADWSEEITSSCSGLSWGHETAEWFEHLTRFLPAGGWQSKDHEGTTAHPGVMLSPFDCSTFLFAWYDGKRRAVRLEVRGSGDRDADAIAIWQEAVRQADESFHAATPSVWHAAVGIYARTHSWGGAQLLDEAGAIGDLLLSPADELLVEAMPAAQFSQTYRSVTRQVRVTGRSRTNPRGEPLATLQLRRLCLVLSVATERLWVVRQPPSLESKPLRTRVPSDAAQPDSEFLDESFAIEPWMDRAFEHLERDTKLFDAAGMYHEALDLIWAHPSMALVSLVSAAETLAERKFGALDRCPTCKVHKGTTARFRALFTEHAIDVRALGTLTDFYARRSSTVHAGGLHGRESLAGLISERLNPFDSRYGFALEVWTLAAAVRAILQNELSGTVRS